MVVSGGEISFATTHYSFYYQRVMLMCGSSGSKFELLKTNYAYFLDNASS